MIVVMKFVLQGLQIQYHLERVPLSDPHGAPGKYHLI